MRPPAYELRGEVVARPAPGLLLVRHEAASGLGMTSMEMMALEAEPALLDAVAVATGDRVRMAVRQRGETIVLLRIEKTR